MRGKKGKPPEEDTIAMSRTPAPSDVNDPIAIVTALAAGQLAELAEIQKGIVLAKEHRDQCKDRWNEAKKILEKKRDDLDDRLHAFTHKPAMPLFDGEQARTDLDAVDEPSDAGAPA